MCYLLIKVLCISIYTYTLYYIFFVMIQYILKHNKHSIYFVPKECVLAIIYLLVENVPNGSRVSLLERNNTYVLPKGYVNNPQCRVPAGASY